MLRYTIRTSNKKIKRTEYKITYSLRGDYYFYFQFSEQHHLNVGDIINIGETYRTTIDLRKQIKIGVGYNSEISKFFVKWRYLNDVDINGNPQEWQMISNIDNLTDFEIPPFQINNSMELFLKVENNILKAKPENCDAYQNIIDLTTINITRFLSENSLLKVSNVFDNFIQIPAFNDSINVRYSMKFWNNTKDTFFFRTDFAPKLIQNVDELYVILNQDTNPRTTTDSNGETANPEIFETLNVGELFSFNPNGNPNNNNGLYETATGIDYINPFNMSPINVLDYEIIEDCTDSYLINIKSIDIGDDTFIPDDIEYIYKRINLNDLQIWRENSFFSLGIPLENKFDIRTKQKELVDRDFYQVERKKAINQVVDMERVQFTPAYPEFEVVNGIMSPKRDGNGNIIYTTIRELEFNFFFDKNNNDENSNGNWGEYNGIMPTYWNTLGFVNDDVKYQRNRLKRTFFRISYFDEKNPTKQNLLYNNTIFTDTSGMYSNYIKANKDNWLMLTENGKKVRVDSDGFTGIVPNVIQLSEVKTNPYFTTTFNIKNPILRNELDGNNSSEGYYIYLTKDKAPEIQPTLCYLKIEFNNASNGKRSLFFNRLKTDDYQQRQNTNLPDGGVDMNNVFLSQTINNVESEDFVYLKVYLSYDVINGRYVYFPANYWCGTATQPITDIDGGQKNDYEPYGGTSSDMTISTNTKKLIINIYEGKVK